MSIKLSTKFALGIALLLVVSFGAMSFLAVRASQTSLREQVLTANHTAATLAARAVDQYIANAVAIMAEAPGRPKLGREIRNGNWPEARKVLENFLRQFTQFDYVFVQDAQGIIRVRVPHAETVGQDFAFRDFFQEAMRTRRLYISGVYVSKAARRAIVSIASPVLDGDSVKGVLVGALSLREMSEFLSTIGEKNNSPLYVIDNNGFLVAHSEGVKQTPVNLRDRAIVLAVMSGSEGTMEFSEGDSDQSFLGAYVAIARLGWGVIAERPASVAYAPADRLGRWLLWVGFGFTAVAIALGWKLSRTLTRPLMRLTRATEKLASGDITARTGLPYDLGEVGQLAQAFDDMAALLEQREAVRRKAEHTLRENEKLKGAILESALDCIIIIDHEGKIVEFNPAAEKTFGYIRADVIGRPMVDLIIPPSLREAHSGGLRHYLATGEGPVLGKRIEIPALSADGTEFPVELTVIRVPVEGPPMFTGFVRDITRRKQAEQEIRTLNADLERRVVERTSQLEAANSELEAFSYSVSHDLRAPLRAVDGFSRILLEKHAADLPPDAQRYLNRVRTNTQQMGRLIDDLLAFSRLGRQPLRKQSVIPADIARHALGDLRHEQSDRKVEITIADLPTCHADPTLLKQVFANLLSNAIKFTQQRDKAQIEIGCMQTDGESVYFVKDNGAGFDMRYADKLFGVFQRLHRAEEFEGTGVGLAIVQRILHRHGGRIWAQANVDEGATFYFTLGGGPET